MSVRFANVAGRGVVVLGAGIVDVEERSNGAFPSDPMGVLARWDAFSAWATGLHAGDASSPLTDATLGPPVPRPAQCYAIGVNYRDHVAEAGMQAPATPMVFTKFPSCLVGSRADVILSSDTVDWEVELVAVIGRGGRRITAARALEHVAGYTVGQDISDRRLQFSDTPPQFCLGKSVDTFGPTGPVLVTLDGFRDPNDLALTTDIDTERMQDGRTSQMIFAVAELIAYVSSYCTLAPGDLMFTGTPAGVGSTRKPRRYLKPGEVITSTIEGIGTMINHCVGAV